MQRVATRIGTAGAYTCTMTASDQPPQPAPDPSLVALWRERSRAFDTPQQTERRGHPRARCLLPVRFASKLGARRAILADLSDQGLSLIAASCATQAGDRVACGFQLRRSGGFELVLVRGTVVWRQERADGSAKLGVALRCSAPASRETLTQLVALFLA